MGLVKTYHALSPRASGGFTVPELCALYGFPKGITGPRQRIAIPELGGGADHSIIQSFISSQGQPPPIIKDISVDGAKNSYTGDPSSADGEVVLDIVVAAQVYSYMTGDNALIDVPFCPNTDTGFLHGVAACRGASACSISWGASEKNWDKASIMAMENEFKLNCEAGTTTTVASGDNLDSDGSPGKNADYPSSSAFVVGCGGTTVVVQNSKIVNELPWNSGGYGTGGGFSSVIPVPAWQMGFVPPNGGRGVPDLCADGDPATGYQTPLGVVGGTSAVAPLMAGYFAAINCARVAKGLHPLGNVNSMLYPLEKLCFYDLTVGNNTG